MDYNLHNTIKEADSELVINLVKRISIGTTPDKSFKPLEAFRSISSNSVSPQNT